MLIILRVIRGRAWSGDTVPNAPMSTGLEFAEGTPSSATDESGMNEGPIMRFKRGSESEVQGSGSTVNVVWSME